MKQVFITKFSAFGDDVNIRKTAKTTKQAKRIVKRAKLGAKVAKRIGTIFYTGGIAKIK